jgi:phage baseplate assembly protein W
MPFITEREDHLLTDLELEVKHRELRPVYGVRIERGPAPGGRGELLDHGIVSGRENLCQAIMMRLLTPRGELAELGHPDYGSRVHELIGEGNTETNRNRLKLFILEAMKREPRVEKIVELAVEISPGLRGTVDVLLKVKPVKFTEIITIGPFSIELG